MQDWNGCASLEQDNGSNGDRISITLTDKRDGNTYTVAKLKDGKCWMTQDIRIQGRTLTSEDSDVVRDFVLPASEIENSFSDSNTAYVYTGGNIQPRCGGYYSWFAATAGEGTSSIASRDGVSVSQSICPKGWDLPTASQLETFTAAYGTTGSPSPNNDIVRGLPVSLNNCGIASSGNISMLATHQGEGQDFNWGGYWSASGGKYGSNPTMIIMHTAGYVYVQHGWTSIFHGIQVRCISK